MSRMKLRPRKRLDSALSQPQGEPEADLAGAIDVLPLREIDHAEAHAPPVVGDDRHRRDEGLVVVVGVALEEHEAAAEAQVVGGVPETAATEEDCGVRL